jgi:hypothetical protein
LLKTYLAGLTKNVHRKLLAALMGSISFQHNHLLYREVRFNQLLVERPGMKWLSMRNPFIPQRAQVPIVEKMTVPVDACRCLRV